LCSSSPHLSILNQPENAGEQPVQRLYLQEVLDVLDMIECFEVPGKKLQLGEITKHKWISSQSWASHPPPRYNDPGIQVLQH
jgi:hypothetical protein